MKKLSKLVLSLGLALTMAACSSGGEAKDVVDDKALDKVEAIMKKTESYKSGEYDGNLKMALKAGKESFDYKIGLTGGYIDDSQLSLSMSMEAAGQKMDPFMAMYMKDNVMYVNAMGQKSQSAVTEESKSPVGDLGVDKETMGLNKKDLKKQLKAATLDGNTVTLKFDTKNMNEDMKKSLQEATSSVSGDADMSLSSMTLKINADKKDIIKSITLKCKGKMEVSGQKADLEISGSLKMDGVNKTTELTFPDDLASYPAGTPAFGE